ncbi:MAG: acyltransferase [Polyangiaceae bacterium]|jgi:peptidoglycan/LPS O-acetylase OafA/YrhL
MSAPVDEVRARPAAMHIPSLDGLRAVSFLVVFGAHAGLADLVPGGFGVTVFFFLSGYLITTLMRMEWESTGTVNLKQFYLRRVFRILPPFYLTLALAMVAATTGMIPGGFSSSAVAAQSLFAANYWTIAHGYSGLPDGTGVYWSLAVEEHFYLFFPLVFMGLRKWVTVPSRQAVVLYAACAAVLLWRLVLVYGLHAAPDRTYLATDTRVDSILFGCALAVYRNPVMDRPSPLPTRWWKWGLLPAAGSLLLFTFLYRGPAFRETLRYSLQGVALTPLFVTATRFPRWLVYRPLNARLASFLGVLSYSLYLVHHVVLAAVQAHVALHPVAQAALALAIAIGLAWGIYHVVEKPCAALRKRLSRTSALTEVAPTTVTRVTQPTLNPS